MTPQLRAGLRERDATALAAFFDVYFDRVYRYVRRLVRDEHATEDLTQDIFLQVHRALSTYDPDRELRPWVFTIATNKVRDFWRSQRHAAGLEETSAGAAGVRRSAADRPDAQLLQSERDEAVRRAIDDLPESMRVAVHLRVYEDLSFEAIGAILGRNEVAVRKRYSRALEQLREALGPTERLQVEGPS